MLPQHNLLELNYKVIKSILTCSISRKNLSGAVMRQTDWFISVLLNFCNMLDSSMNDKKAYDKVSPRYKLSVFLSCRLFQNCKTTFVARGIGRTD